MSVRLVPERVSNTTRPHEPPGGADPCDRFVCYVFSREMTKLKQRPRRDVAQPSPYEEARDEMFQHIMQCGVIGSHPDDQKEWFDNTMQYMTSRYPELNAVQVKDLRTLGERFAQPPRAQTQEAVTA
jgi:hypothetical protein